MTVACAFVVAPSLNLGGLGLGQKPTFSAFSDTTMTPSEAADRIIDPTNFDPAPEAEIVEPPVTDDDDGFAPGLDAIDDVLDGPLFDPDDPTTGDGDAEPQVSEDGSQPVAEPRSDLVNGGRPPTGATGGDDGGPASPADPDTTDGSGVFDGVPPDDGGPGTSPGDGGGSDPGAAPGPENGNDNGTAAPVPHSFDHVSDGHHPYGHVGPPPGHDSKDQDQAGPKDTDAKDKGPQGRATGHGKGQGKGQG